MIPFAEDIEKIDTDENGTIKKNYKKIEQETLKEFMVEYLVDVEKLDSVDKTDKLLFLRDTFLEILKCFDKSKDKDLNWSLFCDRGEQIAIFKEKLNSRSLSNYITHSLIFLASAAAYSIKNSLTNTSALPLCEILFLISASNSANV